MMEAEMFSRRRILSLSGFAGAVLAIPLADAEAQTSGMERRQERRGERVELRYERCGGKPAQSHPAQKHS